MVLSREDWDQVLCWSSKDAHGWGKFGCRVRRVPVLQDGFLESINVYSTILPCVACDQPLDGFDTHLGSAIAVRERHRAKSVVNSPIL